MAALERFVAQELERQIDPEVARFAAELAHLAQGAAAAVLFYGSSLRTGALDGVLDFYVLVDRLSAWPQNRLAAAANAWLPPNVEFRTSGSLRLRAKVAVLRSDQFDSLARGVGVDTSVWARFAQPAAIAWSRDAVAKAHAISSVAQAAATAARWAALLGPARGPAVGFWNALFAETYATELRIERRGRAGEIVAHADARYAALLPLAWAGAGVRFSQDQDGALAPDLTPQEQGAAQRAWRRRRAIGKPLTVLRLMKAVFTFAGAAEYAVWKIERHTGVRVELTPWRRRHPILAAPGVAVQLWRAGVLR